MSQLIMQLDIVIIFHDIYEHKLYHIDKNFPPYEEKKKKKRV